MGEVPGNATTVPRQSRVRTVVLVPPIPWLPGRRSYVADSGPDPFRLDREFEALGLRPLVIDPYPRPLNPFGGMAPLLQSLDPLRAVRILMRNRTADFIISIFEGSAVPLLFLRRFLFFRRKIILWDVALTENWRLRQRILDFVIPRCDGIMVLNSSQVDYIRRRWHVAVPIEVIGHRVDTEFFRPAEFVERGPILSVGDDIGRDFETLIRAVEGLSEQVVIKTLREIPKSDWVTVVRERISYQELRALYARSCFVVVPLHETLNASGVSTILEAGAMGKAMIVTNSGAIADFIIPNETCLTVPPNNGLAMRQAIERLRKDTSLRRKLGENARNFIESQCSDPVFAARFARALFSLSNTS